ncbi:MAG: hypothetical protein DWQ47_03145 [Acidobacteria bacterium]|nr:MAG: hypothetical protein DWQ32_06695 [Acidobacteriota bacterium]REK01400.1 MAG: hypothetical protein DWQ38_03130 [Acidobacteriota bacterium]REK14356.1 MAG: hypothetical protein DWQ43_12385 [Acidobacteriota bacterium]REK45071.1 MAG: hypothetical protein DWQ47_03145 [Acidobacteriota bacterium]
MTRLALALLPILVFLPLTVVSQEKGIDTQTRTIRDSATNDKGNDVSRTFTWDGKTRVRNRLPNPYTLVSRRDVLVTMIVELLKENKMILDESASILNEGLVVTQPVVFSKGPIITRTELNRYAEVPATDQIWTRGRYTLTVDVQSVDGIKNNVYVTAKIEGRSESGIFSEWSTLESSGVAEEEFLSKLVTMTGSDPDQDGRRP